MPIAAVFAILAACCPRERYRGSGPLTISHDVIAGMGTGRHVDLQRRGSARRRTPDRRLTAGAQPAALLGADGALLVPDERFLAPRLLAGRRFLAPDSHFLAADSSFFADDRFLAPLALLRRRWAPLLGRWRALLGSRGLPLLGARRLFLGARPSSAPHASLARALLRFRSTSFGRRAGLRFRRSRRLVLGVRLVRRLRQRGEMLVVLVVVRHLDGGDRLAVPADLDVVVVVRRHVLGERRALPHQHLEALAPTASDRQVQDQRFPVSAAAGRPP